LRVAEGLGAELDPVRFDQLLRQLTPPPQNGATLFGPACAARSYGGTWGRSSSGVRLCECFSRRPRERGRSITPRETPPRVTGSIVSETVLIMLSMANVVAIISVLSTAVVAVAIPFINARLERRRLAWQSKQAQVDELRRFLDDATLRIQEATVVLWEILDVPFPQGPPRTMERLATMERSTFSEDELSRIGALADRYERKFQEITQDKTRLDLRLGPDDSVTRAHAEVTRQLLAFRPRTSAFSDLAKGATTVTVSWSLEQLEILAHLRETLAGEVRAFFGWVRPA
jgi:hypothetical protein